MKIEDYKFNDKCLAFLRKIEKDYGNLLVIEEVDSDFGAYGHAYPLECKPRVEVSKNTLYKEDVIIHEAYHLRLRLEGMPIPSYLHIKRKIKGKEKYKLLFFHQRFWDKIEHHFFFPKIKKELDLNPYLIGKLFLDESFQKIRNSKKIKADEIGIISSILQAWIETEDEAWLKEIMEYFSNKFDPILVEKSKYLIEILNSISLETFEDCFNVYEKFFEYLLPEYRIIRKHKFQTKECSKFSLYHLRYFLGDN